MPLWPVQGPLCLQAVNFNVSVAYRLPARSSLKWSKEMEITGPHAASWTCDWPRRYSCEVMDRPPYRPDLAPRDFHLLGPLRSTWPGNTWQREASCHLLGIFTWHSLLLCRNTNIGVTVGQMVRSQWLLCEIWNVPSATNMSGTHWSLMCTICYQCFRYTLKSDVYHLLPMFQVHTEVRTQLSTWEFWTYFFKFFVHYSSPSPVLKQRLKRST
jgi:hypothetical protein